MAIPDWLRIDKTEGTGNSSVSLSGTINFGRKVRTATIRVVGVDYPDISKSISVTQRANPLYIELNGTVPTAPVVTSTVTVSFATNAGAIAIVPHVNYTPIVQAVKVNDTVITRSFGWDGTLPDPNAGQVEHAPMYYIIPNDVGATTQYFLNVDFQTMVNQSPDPTEYRVTIRAYEGTTQSEILAETSYKTYDLVIHQEGTGVVPSIDVSPSSVTLNSGGEAQTVTITVVPANSSWTIE